MNRLLLAVVAVAVIAVAGFAVFVIASGGSRPSPLVATSAPPVGSPGAGETGAAEPASEAAAPASEGGAPVSATGDDAEANKRFAAWRDSMSANGFTVKAGPPAMADNELALTNLDLTGSGWHWTAAAARVDVSGKENFDLTASGDQTLSFTFNGKAVKYGASGGVKIGMHKGNDGGRVLSVEFLKLSVAGDNETAPITLDSGGLRVVSDDATKLAPLSADGELRLNNLVLPAEAGNSLGSKIDTLSATLLFQQPLLSADPSKALQPWLGQTEALGIRALSLKWGTLKLSGVGVVGLDDAGRPTGRFEVRIADVLGMLDAIDVAHPFDRNALANMYAKLLLDDGREGNDLGLPFTINVANGSVVLSGQSHGIDDIALGAVGQVYAPAAAE